MLVVVLADAPIMELFSLQGRPAASHGGSAVEDAGHANVMQVIPKAISAVATAVNAGDSASLVNAARLQFDEVFAFDRTVSRLLEMQAQEYVATSLRAFPQGPAFVERAFAYAIHHRCSVAHDTHNEGEELMEVASDDTLLKRIGLYCDVLLRNPSETTIQDIQDNNNLELYHDVDLALLKLWRQYRIGSIDEVDQQGLLQPDGCAVLGDECSTSRPEEQQLMRVEDCRVCLGDVAEYAVRLFTQVPMDLAVTGKTVAGSDTVRERVFDNLLPSSLEELPLQGFCSFSQYRSATHKLLCLLTKDSTLQETLEDRRS